MSGTTAASTIPYRPTSLDFINRPNPVEPHAAAHKHPLDVSPRLNQNESRSGAHFLHNAHHDGQISPQPSAKRRRRDDNPLNLPRPPIRKETRRPMIPPTLSGLHQPPPNAGLLPRITVEQPNGKPSEKAKDPPNVPSSPLRSAEVWIASSVMDKSPGDRTGGTSAKEAAVKGPSVKDPVISERPVPPKFKRRKWSDDETSDLLKGVSMFGIGSWTRILHHPAFQFADRSALDLKDRFRVCCPDDYKTARKGNCYGMFGDTKATFVPRPTRSDRMSKSELHKLGIQQPFFRSQRRKRRGYSKEEDDAIQRGYDEHGSYWTAILEDSKFSILNGRTARDLRDRFRTRFPERYKLHGPPEIGSKGRDGPSQADKEKFPIEACEPLQSAKLDQFAVDRPPTSSAQNGPKEPGTFLSRKQPIAALLTSPEDVFWSEPYGGDEAENMPITLDRQILDWAQNEHSKTSAQGETAQSQQENSSHLRSNHSTTQGTSNLTLPSLATVTAGMSVFDDAEGQLELPSLMKFLGSFEGDGKSGTQLSSVYDILC